MRRGIWRSPVAEVVQAPREVPTFHVFASEWFERQKIEGGRCGSGLSDAGRDAGVRTVNVLSVLRDELGDYRARMDPLADALVFGTATSRRQGATNVRRRVLAKAVERANTKLAEDEAEPLPDGLTPHSLRRTFASLLFAIGETPPYVMAQMGHTTPTLTLAIYARQMDRRDGEPERLKALVDGLHIQPSPPGPPPRLRGGPMRELTAVRVRDGVADRLHRKQRS